MKKKIMHFSDFYDIKNQKFISLYKYTKLKSSKISDIFLWKNIKKFVCSKIFTVTWITSLLLTMVELLGYLYGKEKFVNPMSSIIEVLIGGQIGLLGFIIAGVTLLLSSVDDNLLDIIDKRGMAVNILSLFFSFYYIAVIIGISVILLVIMNLIISMELPVNGTLFIFFSIVLNLIIVYSLVYSISLIGTCIKITILRHKYWEESKKSPDRE